MARKISYACTLLLILLAANVGQKVHIFLEDPLHYEAFCRDVAPDNGAACRVVAKCDVDDYFFFPCVCTEQSVTETFFMLLGRPGDRPTCSKRSGDIRFAGLRAPPVVA